MLRPAPHVLCNTWYDTLMFMLYIILAGTPVMLLVLPA